MDRQTKGHGDFNITPPQTKICYVLLGFFFEGVGGEGGGND